MQARGWEKARRSYSNETEALMNFYMIKKLFSSQLRLNMTTGVATHCVNIVVLAVTYPVCLHYMGYEQYGIWLALSAVLIFARVSDMGMVQALTKLVAEEIGKGNSRNIQKYIATSLYFLLAVGSIVFTFIVLLKIPIIASFRFDQENAAIALWLLPHIAILSLYVIIVKLFQATLDGLGRMDLSNYIETGRRIVLLGASIVFLHYGYGIKSLVIATWLSLIVKHLSLILILRRMIPYNFFNPKYFSIACFRELMNIGIGLFGSTIIQMAGISINNILLARYAGIEFVPVFEMAWRGSMQIRNLLGMAFKALMPEISRISSVVSSDTFIRIRKLMKHAIFLVLALAIPLLVVLEIFADHLFRFWLRGSYVEIATPTFRIILLGTSIGLLAVPIFQLMIGLGKIKIVFIANCITWVVDILLLIIYIFCFGAVSTIVAGMCLSSSTIMSACYLHWMYYCINKRAYAK